MQQDIWTNTSTATTLGVTGPLGSPRGWLRRALNVSNLDDTTFHETSITPPEISVAGIWYLPVTGLPATGAHRELIRWFSIPGTQHMIRKNNKELLPAVGIAAAVPYHEVSHWVKVYQESGAVFTWWKRPENKSVRASSSEKPQRRQLDHAAIYALLDEGLKPSEIARKLEIPVPNIEYVKKKWTNGDVLSERRVPIDLTALIADYRAGATAIELAEKYETSESYVYRIMRGAKR
jgi:hypothetical protein